jgi:transcriptional regulator with XRE-family HTH domain
MVDEEVSARLAGAIRARRTELGMSQNEVVIRAAQAGRKLSTQTVTSIERGQRDRLRPQTAEALETALQWPAGYVAALLGDHVPVAPAPDEVAALRGELAQLRGQVATLGGISVDVKAPDIRTVAAVIRMFSPEQRRVFAQALAAVEAEG